MLKFNALTTAIRIQKPILDTNENDFETSILKDILDEDILCEWKNKFGDEVYSAASLNAKEPAAIRLWYIPGIDKTCKVLRVEDMALFDIVNVDDVGNRHQQLEIEIKRYVKG